MTSRDTTRLVVLGALCAFLAAPAWAQPPVSDTPGGPPVSQCPVLAVTGQTSDGVQVSRSFSARAVVDLNFQIIFTSELERDRLVTLKVFSPTGHLYRAMAIPVAPPRGDSPAGARNVEGYPYPVPVHTAQRAVAGNTTVWVADVTFPVAGTAIVSRGLDGTWRVETWLEGATQPCLGRTTFSLRE